MPGPPPPPPPGAPPPMMPSVFTPPKGGGADSRGALLKSIQQGTKLKKTVTNDKSAPLIPGKISNNNSNSSSSGSNYNSNSSPSSTPNGMVGLGGLFAGGMPKLRPTGKLGASNLNNSNSNNNYDSHRKPEPVTPTKNMHVIQNELKKQLASDSRNRGPPPPAPSRNLPDDQNRPSYMSRTSNSNGFQNEPNSLQVNSSTLHTNSTLHRKTKSSANLSSLDMPDNVNIGFNTPPKVINYGKPNLAPKPPALNGKPLSLPKKGTMNGNRVSRAHSMKSPRSPSPQSPDANTPIKFGTVRNMSSVLSQSLANSTNSLSSPRPRPSINSRPTAPPPSAPPPPPAYNSMGHQSGGQLALPLTKVMGVKAPNHAPPPPPGACPQPPTHPPPLPPHKSHRAPPAIPNNNTINAPPPPPRNSSMRETNTVQRRVIDLEEKFKDLFNPQETFPKPPPFRNVPKQYSNKQVINKQQAPQPPHMHPVGNRVWPPTAC